MSKNTDRQEAQDSHTEGQLGLAHKQLPDSAASKNVQDLDALFKRSSLLLGVLCCAIGGFFMPEAHALPSVMIAYGGATLFSTQNTTQSSMAIVSVFVPVILRVYGLSISSLLYNIVLIGLVLIVAYMVARLSYSLSKELLVILVATLLIFSIDTMFSKLEGYSLKDGILSSFDLSVTELRHQNLELKLELQSVREYIELLWPMVYAADTFFLGILAYVGARGACNKLGIRAASARLDSFTLPRGLAVLGFGALTCMLLASARQDFWTKQLYFAGINLFYVLRLPLSLQALGLIGVFAHKKGASRSMVAISYLVGIFLELSSYVLSVLGLVDIVADFRGLRCATIQKEES